MYLLCVDVCVQTGNGETGPGAVLLDVNGIYGVDRVYEGADYNSRCDYAAPLGACADPAAQQPH